MKPSAEILRIFLRLMYADTNYTLSKANDYWISAILMYLDQNADVINSNKPIATTKIKKVVAKKAKVTQAKSARKAVVAKAYPAKKKASK